jgi:hypothetical protein
MFRKPSYLQEVGHWRCTLEGFIFSSAPPFLCLFLFPGPVEETALFYHALTVTMFYLTSGLETLEESDHGMTPQVKINLSFFKLIFSGILSQDRKLTQICIKLCWSLLRYILVSLNSTNILVSCVIFSG